MRFKWYGWLGLTIVVAGVILVLFCSIAAARRRAEAPYE